MTATRAPILALSNIIIDDVRLADGTLIPGLPGGAALYAATGAALWWPEVAIVAGVGADLHALTGNRLRDWGLREEGLLVRDRCSIHSSLVYEPDGSRTETPMHGPAHFRSMHVMPAEIPDALLPAAGTYVFQPADAAYWQAIGRRRDRLGPILWEVWCEGDRPAIAELRLVLDDVDIVSLNREEGQRLLGLDAPRDMVERLLDWGAPVVVLRMGAEGALIGRRGEVLRLRPPASPVRDVTGGGNAFCGGFLAGWCERPGDLVHAGRCAAAAAARALAQFGPADPRDREMALPLAAAARIERLDTVPA